MPEVKLSLHCAHSSFSVELYGVLHDLNLRFWPHLPCFAYLHLPAKSLCVSHCTDNLLMAAGAFYDTVMQPCRVPGSCKCRPTLFCLNTSCYNSYTTQEQTLHRDCAAYVLVVSIKRLLCCLVVCISMGPFH